MKRPIINKLADRLRVKGAADVLDIGTGDAGTALYLARMGHRVLSITNDMTEVVQARSAADDIGVAEHCEFQYMDAVDLFTSLNHHRFDAVVMTNVLQEFPRSRQIDLIDHAKRITRSGGLHVVSGYVVDHALGGSDRYKNALAPGQLLSYYSHDPGWGILEYQEDEPNRYESAGMQLVNSHADLIARKVERPRLPTDNF